MGKLFLKKKNESGNVTTIGLASHPNRQSLEHCIALHSPHSLVIFADEHHVIRHDSTEFDCFIGYSQTKLARIWEITSDIRDFREITKFIEEDLSSDGTFLFDTEDSPAFFLKVWSSFNGN